MPQRIIFPEQGETDLVDFELDPLGIRQLVARTLYSLMSIGTETTILHQRYDPASHFAQRFSFPQLKTGVQTVALVESTGAGVRDFSAGDHVYIRSGHRSHHVLDAKQCSPIPAGVDLKQATWCGLAKTAFRAAWAAPFSNCESLLIVGAGPVGQMCTRWAKVLGAKTIMICDWSADRLGHAERGGATSALRGSLEDSLEEILALTGGEGPTVVVDSTGNPDVLVGCLAAVRRFGKIVVVGDTGYPERQHLSSHVMTKGLTIVATHDSHDRDGWTQRNVDSLFFSHVGQNRFPLGGLISHEFSPRDHHQAYRLAEEDRSGAMGILFDWTGEG